MAKVWLRKRALLATFCLAVFIVFSLRQKGETDSDVGEKVQSENSTENNTICGSSVKLSPFIPIEGDEGRKRMFFIETSGHGSLSPRQLCAVESLLRTNPDLKANLLFLSTEAGAPEKRPLCQMMKGLGNLKLWRMVEKDLEGTPLKRLFSLGTFQNSSFPAAHLSDALRLLYLYKHGGWYSDLDAVFLRPLPDPNMGGGKGILSATSDSRQGPLHLANGIMHLPKRHMLTKEYLKTLRRNFSVRHRTANGPSVITRVYRKICNLSEEEPIMTGENLCHGLSVLSFTKLLAVRHFEIGSLWPNRSVNVKHWEDLISDSFAVHFYSYKTKTLPLSFDERRDLYSYLAPRLCPISFKTNEEF